MITQSGKDKSRLTPEDLMICDMQGRPKDRGLIPSAETALHLLPVPVMTQLSARFSTRIR